ncbi:ketoreductase [Pseudohyphozyma bogoriensis]|nr:ketoreductase [Pseudohyphozyma bogoriensis]
MGTIRRTNDSLRALAEDLEASNPGNQAIEEICGLIHTGITTPCDEMIVKYRALSFWSWLWIDLKIQRQHKMLKERVNATVPEVIIRLQAFQIHQQEIVISEMREIREAQREERAEIGEMRELHSEDHALLQEILLPHPDLETMVPSPQLVLVTGASGYIGAETCLEFLRQGFSIRQALRTQAQADAWSEKFPEYASRVEFAIVPDITKPGAFDEAIVGVDAVCHTASPVTFIPKDNRRDLLDPAIQGTLSILESTKKEPKIKAMVITSSVSAYVDYKNPFGPEHTLTAKDWNPTTYEEAAELGPEFGTAVYNASKGLAEKAAWKFMEDNKPTFTLATVAPTWVLGASNEPSLKTYQDRRSSFGMQADYIVDVDEFPPGGVNFYVNVIDIAKAHVGAIVHNKVASGKRYLLIAGRHSRPEAARLAAKAVPEMAHRFPSIAGAPFAPAYNFDSKAAEEDFGFTYIGYEETIAAWAKQIFSLPVA